MTGFNLWVELNWGYFRARGDTKQESILKTEPPEQARSRKSCLPRNKLMYFFKEKLFCLIGFFNSPSFPPPFKINWPPIMKIASYLPETFCVLSLVIGKNSLLETQFWFWSIASWKTETVFTFRFQPFLQMFVLAMQWLSAQNLHHFTPVSPVYTLVMHWVTHYNCSLAISIVLESCTTNSFQLLETFDIAFAFS